MCRIQERVYIGLDGSRQVLEEAFPCEKAHGRKLCSKIKRRTTEHFPQAPAPPRDDASSPASNNPPTPTGTGTYLVERRRPSGHTQQPSQGDGARVVKPMINIEFNSKKGKSKIYPHISVSSSKSSKRSSLGSASVNSNEVAIESPGSDASYPIRTGYPEASIAPVNSLSQPPGYNVRHAMPLGQHRHTSSSSSQTSSGQPPSLYATSEPESPGRRPARYPPTIVHNPLPGVAAPSQNTSRGHAPASSGRYRTTVVTPQSSSRENVGADGLTPLDYSDFHDRSTSSHASSSQAAPEITARDADRARRRKKNEDDRKRQEENDRLLAQDLARQEEIKQVRFELGRPQEREKQRGENRIAESEKRRAEVREEARQRKKDTKRPEREKTKPPVAYTEHSKRRSRRSSMTQADIDEMERLRQTEEAQMARERHAAEVRERGEQADELRRQQQTNEYWDPRGGNRMPIPNNGPGVGRRGSISGGRRGSVSSTAPSTGLGRKDSNRRVSVIQPVPPPLTTSFPQQSYSTRPSSSQNNAPGLFSPGSYTPGSHPPSARHSSYHDNPFALPPTRTSQSSQESNPFAQPPTRNVHPGNENPFTQQPSLLHSPDVVRDPWDARDMRDALPRSSSHRGQQPRTIQHRGEAVIHRSGQDRASGHRHAQQATQNMGRVMGYKDHPENSPSEEDDEDTLAVYGGRAGRRRHGN